MWGLTGTPTVVLGPGDIAQAHTADEWIELAQVDAAADIRFARRLVAARAPVSAAALADPAQKLKDLAAERAAA